MNDNNTGSKSIRVLVVDDSLLIHKFIAKIISQEGYDVCGVAADGKEAVDKYRQLSPDITIMDINMPVVDGIEATKLIKEINPEANVIFMGSAIDKNINQKADQLGVKYFIDKPFEKDKMIEVLGACAENRDLQTMCEGVQKRKEISNIISPFFRALEDVMNFMLEIEGQVKFSSDNDSSFEMGGYSVVVGFNGKISGGLLLNVSVETAWKLAERVNRETYSNKNDAFIGYSIQELANIICGNALKVINNTERNLNLRLTPPVLFRGSSMSILAYNSNPFKGVMETEFGDINISIMFE